MRVHELHAPVKVVQRSAGRSATAAAAYRSGSRIEDERTGQVFDYTRKQGIEAEALILPDNAPEWAHDRAKLWNAAEMREAHPRAQTARDLTVSFPSEFSDQQRREAGMKIGQWIMFRHGAAVDVAWHEPSRQGDERNHHAHFLFTTRRFDENGEWAKSKDRTLDDLKKGPDEIRAMRLGVADVLNNIATRDRLEVYVEHLSFEQRGLDREATQHLGPIATQMEREGVETDIGNKNREIRRRNEQREALREEEKVIDIAVAREQLRLKERQEKRAPSPTPEKQRPAADPMALFYREAQDRRAAMLQGLDRQHAAREKELRGEIVDLTQSMENAGFFGRIWRGVTGRARAEREQMATASRALEQIQQERLRAHEAFERDRVMKLEGLKAAQAREAQEREAQAQRYLTRAVGERQAAQQGVGQQPAAQARTTEQAPSPAPGGSYEARRREYFQRLGAQRQAEREEKQTPGNPGRRRAPARDFVEASTSEDAEAEKAQRDERFKKARESNPLNFSKEERAVRRDQSPTLFAYEAREAAYLRKAEREKERGEERAQGPTPDPE